MPCGAPRRMALARSPCATPIISARRSTTRLPPHVKAASPSCRPTPAAPWRRGAAPAVSYAPMVLDIASTGVARGKIYRAKQKGLPIPEGWAIDAGGAPTTDASAAIDGIILPMAGHKGYAIAAMMDMLSGVLTGSAFGSGVFGPYQTEHKSGAGQMIIVLDIEKFQPLAEFNARMEKMIAELKAEQLAQGHDEIFYP